jgi:tRNA(Ile)-lysidine synthase
MGGPHPAVAEIRTAVRVGLADLAPGDLVLVACSGGADSLALAAALAFTAPRLHLRAGGVTVDHGLQPGSAERARAVAARLTTLGLEPVVCTTVTVPGRGDDLHPGPEAAARTARYQALDAAAGQTGAAAILLGHTLDDQAETVLLRLARGSGARSLAAMPGRRGRYLRPLLPVRRATTQAACAALGLPVWDDPHNDDPRFTRVRVRHEVLPVLESVLGPGVAEALARTAGQLRDDADALDALARAESDQTEASRPEAGPAETDPVEAGPAGDVGFGADRLAALPAAIRTRVLHRAAVAAGCPAGSLTAGHVQQLGALVTGWRGQRWVDLPGGVRGFRRDGQVRFTRTDQLTGPQQEGDRGRGRPGHGPAGSTDQRGAAGPADSGARRPD